VVLSHAAVLDCVELSPKPALTIPLLGTVAAPRACYEPIAAAKKPRQLARITAVTHCVIT
jgi:hypothetical protein